MIQKSGLKNHFRTEMILKKRTYRNIGFFWGQQIHFGWWILNKNPFWLVDFEHKSSLKVVFELCFEKIC